MNEKSASASENFAMSMKHINPDNVIISTKTQGKGTGQIDLKPKRIYNKAIVIDQKYSLGEYNVPVKKGGKVEKKSIQIQGVSPDILINPLNEDISGLNRPTRFSNYKAAYRENKNSVIIKKPHMSFFCLRSEANDLGEEIVKSILKERIKTKNNSSINLKDQSLKEAICKAVMKYEWEINNRLKRQKERPQLTFHSLKSRQNTTLPEVKEARASHISLNILLKSQEIIENKEKIVFSCIIKNNSEATLYNANISIDPLFHVFGDDKTIEYNNSIKKSKFLNPIKEKEETSLDFEVIIPETIYNNRDKHNFLIDLDCEQLDERNLSVSFDIKKIRPFNIDV
jgi:hypothetical protein